MLLLYIELCFDTIKRLNLFSESKNRFSCDVHVSFFSFTGYYIHHIDDFINVRKFELNFRPPEEFYMNFEIHTSQEIQAAKASQMKSSDQTLTSAQDVTSGTLSSNQSQSSTLTRTAIPDISKSSLKRKDSKKVKNKTKDSPVTPKNGMLSCFGIGSLKKKKDKTKR